MNVVTYWRDRFRSWGRSGLAPVEFRCRSDLERRHRRGDPPLQCPARVCRRPCPGLRPDPDHLRRCHYRLRMKSRHSGVALVVSSTLCFLDSRRTLDGHEVFGGLVSNNKNIQTQINRHVTCRSRSLHGNTAVWIDLHSAAGSHSMHSSVIKKFFSVSASSRASGPSSS